MAKKTTTPKPTTTTITTASPTSLRPLKGRGWWGDLLARRDDEWGDTLGAMWGDRETKGARGLDRFLGGGWAWRPRGDDDDVWAFTEVLRFARGFARIVAGEKLHQANWFAGYDGQRERIPYADLATGQIMLDPKPVRDSIAGAIERDAARTVVAGVAIHEAAHLRATPLDWLSGFLERHGIDLRPDEAYERDADGQIRWGDDGEPVRKVRRTPDFPDGVARAARAMVEDAFVETVALATYPGYQAYLAECWAYVRPESKIIEEIRNAIPTEHEMVNTAACLMEVIQDRSRRYSAPGDDYERVWAELPADMRTYVEAGERILRRAHDHTLTNAGRWDLSTDLARLLARGEVAEQDREELGGQAWRPSERQLEQLETTCINIIRTEGLLDGDDRGATLVPLNGRIAGEVNEAIQQDMQREDVTIRTPDGTRSVAITWLDHYSNPGATAQARAEIAPLVAPLARRLAFRAATPDRLLGGQKRGRLDDRRLADIPAALATGDQPRAFARRERIEAPKIALPVLVDMSGSMHGRKIQTARAAAVLAYDALSRLRRETAGGVDFTIHGHTSREEGEHDVPVIYRLVDRRHPGPDRLGAIAAHSQNYDGPALAAIAALATKTWPDRRRCILYLNDGQPSGEGYGGHTAMREIASHRQHLRARGTDILTIFVGGGASDTDLELMYGQQGTGWVRVPDVRDLPDALAAALKRLLKWQA